MSRDQSRGHVARNVKNERAPVHPGFIQHVLPPPVPFLNQLVFFRGLDRNLSTRFLSSDS